MEAAKRVGGIWAVWAVAEGSDGDEDEAVVCICRHGRG